MGDEIITKSDIQKEEEKAYIEWKSGKDAFPIPLELAAGMYELYLNSYSCTDIYRINGMRYPLGQIVDSKVRYEWDKRRDSQLANLFGNIEKKVLVTKNEAVSHLADLLAVAHKVWRDKLMKFIQEGDPKYLEGLDFYNIRNYKEILSLFNSMTDDTKNINQGNANGKMNVAGTVKHVVTVTDVQEKHKVKTSTDASELLRMIENAEVVDGDK